MGSWKTLSVLMLGQSNFVGTLIGHYLEDLGRKNCFISVSHLLTCLLYAILKLLQEGKGAPGQTPLLYRVTTIHPHLPPLQPFRRKEVFHLCLSLAHLLTLCHIEATPRRKGGTRTDTPALKGYHHSPPPSSPLFSSTCALWAIAELYILGPSLPFSLSFFLSFFLPLVEIW